MNSRRRISTWAGAILGSLCALVLVGQLHAVEHPGQLTEEFHQTYPLAPNGRVSLENINGPVHINAWDRNEVKVDAVKYAHTKERLDEAKIRVEAQSDSVHIHTEYPHQTQTFTDDDRDNPASVEYTLTVPRKTELDNIELINGALDVNGTTGEVRASCINGRLRAGGLGGRVKLSTVNGPLDVAFASLEGTSIDLESVNGSLRLTLPSDAKAEIEASTVHGGIENDFGLRVVNHRYVGHDLDGQLGGGGTRIRLNNVNGRIEVRHANDNRALSPATNTSSHRDDDRDDDDNDDGDSI
ncbi:MAG TPA: DUF4097 family beta strand repeat-containing protein [Terriglobales bacterium]